MLITYLLLSSRLFLGNPSSNSFPFNFQFIFLGFPWCCSFLFNFQFSFLNLPCCLFSFYFQFILLDLVWCFFFSNSQIRFWVGDDTSTTISPVCNALCILYWIEFNLTFATVISILEFEEIHKFRLQLRTTSLISKPLNQITKKKIKIKNTNLKMDLISHTTLV